MESLPVQRPFCRRCNRTQDRCFCAQVREFVSPVELAIVVHPQEAGSTVGTAWILRRSIRDLHWWRSNGSDLDRDARFARLLEEPSLVPFLLYPGRTAINLNRVPDEEWSARLAGRRPLFIVVDGTWTQAAQILRQSAKLRSLPRASFDVTVASEYGFKRQPRELCLSCVEGVHRVYESIAARGWAPLPAERAHDRMVEIFREMVRFQLSQETRGGRPSRVAHGLARQAALRGDRKGSRD